MGNLVFQATLGGQVNLVGPNTASTYNINVPAVAGTMVTTGDTGTVSSTMLASSLSLTTPNIGVATGTSLKVSAGFYSTSTSSFTYTDGIVMDYTTGLGRISVGTSDGIAFYNAGVATTELMRLDASGNLGLGVTPSTAWATSSITAALQFGARGSLAYYSGVTDLAINDAAGTYIASSVAASRYRQQSGKHIWSTATSGTAGANITYTDAMTLDASGNLLVGTTNASETSGIGIKLNYNATVPSLTVIGSGSTNAADTYHLYSTGAGAYRFYVDYGGTIHATSIVITAISDERLKENVRDIDTGLSSVMALKPRRYDWKEGKGLDKKNAAGFIAQEFETVFPESVGTTKAGEDGIEYKNINYEKLIPTLVKAIQEQQALITQLQADVAAMKA